ncbi:MAG TPA: hypothetical protein VHN36_14665, partial [Ilumatobacteraceae bacterium]|nr:hypothetical protein [Ilumatobacteraceae bacterium]
MHDAVARIHEAADLLREEHTLSDEAGQLTDKAAIVLRESGGIRLLQAASYGGFEADPSDFFEWVRAVAQYNPSAGWIAGVVGVHPWELALADPKLQDEIYGTDPDTWVASPYAPQGRAKPVDGGFLFSGEWQYSTGTDHCDWIILGGMVTDANGDIEGFPDVRHFVLPRIDYEIVENSWNVMGLGGTGSKNIRISDAFVPDYRTISHFALADGEYGQRRADTPLYQLPFGCVFSAAIASATFGIARGAIDAYRDYLATRISTLGVVGKTDPFQQEALAEAESDLAAGIVHVDTMINAWLERVREGDRITITDRLEFRRNQVRAVQRVLFSIDKLFSRAGSAAVWTTRPLERYWR